MAYFPFYIDIENKKILVVGGGTVALRKIEKLMPFSPDITVVAPKICDEIKALNVKIIDRRFCDSDLDGAFCVVSATDDETLNGRIFQLCNEKNILVNTVDDKEKCGFIFPAIASKNGITAGITTSGKSPIYAKYLKELFMGILESMNENITEVLWKYRPIIKEKVEKEDDRRKIFEQLLSLCLSGLEPDEKTVENLIEEYEPMTIKIGTRKSRLALAQTEMLIKTLKNRFPNVEIETVYISTTGDKTLDKPLAALGGKGVFIKELEMSLLSGETDVAVHSAKDLPTKIADGLEISAVLPRGSYGDVFVTRNNFETKDGFVIGTGSLRRKLFAEKIYPNAKFKDIRGNVDTRLKKLLNGEYDALVLAKAGLERLDLCNGENYTVIPFDTDEFLPAPCQGIVAIESRKNSEVSKMLAEISDKNTMLSFETERQVLHSLNADCSTPVGAISKVENDRITLYLSADCKKTVSGTDGISNRIKLAKRLVSEIE